MAQHILSVGTFLVWVITPIGYDRIENHTIFALFSNCHARWHFEADTRQRFNEIKRLEEWQRLCAAKTQSHVHPKRY